MHVQDRGLLSIEKSLLSCLDTSMSCSSQGCFLFNLQLRTSIASMSAVRDFRILGSSGVWGLGSRLNRRTFRSVAEDRARIGRSASMKTMTSMETSALSKDRNRGMVTSTWSGSVFKTLNGSYNALSETLVRRGDVHRRARTTRRVMLLSVTVSYNMFLVGARVNRGSNQTFGAGDTLVDMAAIRRDTARPTLVDRS